MKYVIVTMSGVQHILRENESFSSLKIKDLNKEKPLEISEVLLVRNEDKIMIGKPYVKGAKVVLDFEKEERGEKIHVYKFKAKVRYRRKTGFRSDLMRFKVKSINLS